MQKDLLGALVADVAHKIGAGASVRLRFRKDELLDTETTEDGYAEQWKMIIDDVHFRDREGARRRRSPVTVHRADFESKEERGLPHPPALHRCARGDAVRSHGPGSPAELGVAHDDRPHWRGLLRKEQVTAKAVSFSAALDAAFHQNVVSPIPYLPAPVPDVLLGIEQQLSVTSWAETIQK